MGSDRPGVAMHAHHVMALVTVLWLAAAGASAARQVAVAPGRAPSQPLAQAPATTGTGAITGTVVDQTTGLEIGGALVTLLDRSVTGPLARRPASTLTDRRGRFAFVDLPASNAWTLGVAAAGYLDHPADPDVPPGRLGLADGQWRADVRLEITPAGSIGGVVTDEAGDPVVGAWVRLLTRVPVAGTSYLAGGPITRTDDRGAYFIGGLQPGTYYVVMPSVQAAVPGDADAAAIAGITPAIAAQRSSRGITTPIPVEHAVDADPRARLILGDYPVPPGAPRTAYPITFHPGGSTIESATAIALGAGEQRDGADLRLAPVPTVSISGRVDGPAEALAGLTLRLLPESLTALGPGSEAATARVAADGTFVLLGVPAGRYVLTAPAALAEYQTYSMIRSLRLPGPPGRSSGGYSSRSVTSAPAGTQFTTWSGGYLAGDACAWGRTTIDAGATDVTDARLVLRPCMTISGRVTMEGAPGPGEPPPVLGVTAQAADGDPSLGQPNPPPRGDGPADAFEIPGLLPGQYLLQARGLARGWVVKSIVHQGRDYTDTPFDTTGGDDYAGVQVTFTNRTAEIDGRVQTGAPGAAATPTVVVLFPVDRRLWTNYGREPARLRSALAGSDGSFSFASLQAGEYFVAAVAVVAGSTPAPWQTPGWLANAAANAERVTVDWGGHATVSPRVAEVRR
ncbi:MAG: carboxypeptidase-like regulatory domain-containing protein [Vicinamibacterales bacterium]